MKWKKLKET